ncbi:MAG: hypothetical protein B6D56_06655 [Candidatus Omnitrophica bacterium 4484_70.1]|nr:MAG: hypothetical protein B6D56_06655 [Candidatus Omnitrophica bacterium 4484_70.1]
MNILFITRNFPPQVGGLENFSFNLFRSLPRENNLFLIKWSGSKKFLGLIFPYFLIKSYIIVLFKKIDLIYLTDGLLSLLIPFLKVSQKPIVITLHGLDITFKNRFYQLIIPHCFSWADKIVCVSKATKRECKKRGVGEKKIEIIPDGVEDKLWLKEDKKMLQKKFRRKFKIDVEEKKIILSVGRLIKRKGIHWFIEKSIPLLLGRYKNFIYLIVGEGVMEGYINEIIKKKNWQEYIVLLKGVDDEDLKLIYNIADVFVMPNIKVKGDMEGLGIVLLEAASCNLPIVASDIEGIRDALLEGKLGKLVKCYDSKAFAEEILKILQGKSPPKENLRKLVKKNFSWEKVSQRYNEVFYSILRRNRPRLNY